MAIQNHPLQAYASGLVFSPAASRTRIQLERQEPALLIRKPTMRTVGAPASRSSTPNSSANSVTFSLCRRHHSEILIPVRFKIMAVHDFLYPFTELIILAIIITYWLERPGCSEMMDSCRIGGSRRTGLPPSCASKGQSECGTVM